MAPTSPDCRPQGDRRGHRLHPEGRKVFPKLTVEENLRLGAYQETSDAVTNERMTEIYRCFPAWPSAARSSPAPCRAASRRWYRSAAD
jgi:ABC-type branched-subunit amino acid transport system ATPase component